MMFYLYLLELSVLWLGLTYLMFNSGDNDLAKGQSLMVWIFGILPLTVVIDIIIVLVHLA